MAVPRFWRETSKRYNLIGTLCTNCNEKYFPPRIVCPKCHRKSIGKLKDFQFSGKGKIVTYTVIHDSFNQFRLHVPYIIAIVELAEGPKITAQIVDCEPSEVNIGMEVQATFRKIGEEGKSGIIYYGYKFRPA